jgi:hypothetical protein
MQQNARAITVGSHILASGGNKTPGLSDGYACTGIT